MKIITVKVTYGVKKEFAAKNKENIGFFMADFQAMDSKDFKYDVYILDDETTFVHISSYANEHIQNRCWVHRHLSSSNSKETPAGLRWLTTLKCFMVLLLLTIINLT